MTADDRMPPTTEEYAARMRFLHRCLERFLSWAEKTRGKRLYFHRNASRELADYYYRLAAQMREELDASIPVPDGDDRRRIDRHKIAAGLLKTINALRPIRMLENINEEQPGFNALFGYYVVVAFFEQWHESTGRNFSVTPCGRAFAVANIWWLKNHQHDVPHQLMAQTLYLFEMTCMLEKQVIDSGR